MTIYSVFTYIGLGILYPPIGVIHGYDDTKCQQFICYGHKSIGKYALKFTKFSVSFAFFKKLNIMRNYFERLEEVIEVNIQLFMQSRISTTNVVNIDPIVLKLCCVE